MNSLMSLGAQPGFGNDIGGAIAASVTDKVAGGPLALVLVPAFVLLAYLVLTFDRRRDGSPSRDDGQLGIKVVLFGILASAVVVVAVGATEMLGFVLGGFKGGWARMRDPLATVLSVGGVGVAVYLVLLPRTNHLEKPQAERLALGLVSAIAGAATVLGAETFVRALLATAPWGDIASGLAMVGVWGGVAILAIFRLGALSGWRAVPRVPQMPMMQPPMAGQPPQAGMPPLGGGYPPQVGGGYPPQGGGWPPQ